MEEATKRGTVVPYYERRPLSYADPRSRRPTHQDVANTMNPTHLSCESPTEYDDKQQNKVQPCDRLFDFYGIKGNFIG